MSGRAVRLEQFRAQPEAVAALVLAAGGSEPVLDSPTLQLLAAVALRPRQRSRWRIDFGVPPNLDPEEARGAGIVRIGMGELVQEVQERRVTELLRLAPVRAAIDERMAQLRDEMATRAIGPQLAELRDAFERIAADELERAMTAELRGLTNRSARPWGSLTSRLARRLAHLPIAGMRAAAAHVGPEAIEAFFGEARLQRGAHADTLPAGATEAPTPEKPLP